MAVTSYLCSGTCFPDLSGDRHTCRDRKFTMTSSVSSNSWYLKVSMQGMTILSPGPLAPPFLILPSLKMTALSYSLTV